MTRRTWGMYASRVCGEGSSPRQCSSTVRRSTTKWYRSLEKAIEHVSNPTRAYLNRTGWDTRQGRGRGHDVAATG